MIRARLALGAAPVVIEFPEGKDPFDILDRCCRAVDGVVASSPPPPDGVRDTSRASYRRLKATGKLTVQQTVVAGWLKAHGAPATRQEIARGTGLGINVVSGRVNELLQPDVGAVEEVGKRRCSVTGETAHTLAAITSSPSWCAPSTAT